jgi:hypothetical protein
MLMRSGALSIALLCALGASAREPVNHGPAVEKAFASSASIQFYFVSRTGTYTLTEEAMKHAATVKVFRSCGNNCAAFMKPVTEHLKNARAVKCQSGQEDVLIAPSNGPSLMFSFSGRVLRYGSTCYLSPTSIDPVLKSQGFFFN